MKTRHVRRGSTGFTLIELLAVMAIISILATVSSISLSTMMRANSISLAANLAASELNHARTVAISRSSSTELRLVTSTVPPCVQIVLILNDGSSVLITRKCYFPEGVVISPNSTYSGVQTLPQQKIPTGQPNAGAIYYAIRFSPSGVPRDSSGNALTTTNNYFTLLSSQDAGKSQLPSNWITLTVDDRTGDIRRYQP